MPVERPWRPALGGVVMKSLQVGRMGWTSKVVVVVAVVVVALAV